MQNGHLPAASWDLGNGDHDSGNFTTFLLTFTLYSPHYVLRINRDHIHHNHLQYGAK